MTDDGTGLLTIGELARVTGLTVRTIRYWSDEGVLTPMARSSGGYRLYDTACVARLELIRTLRELGLGLADVRRVLAGERSVAEVAATHVVALDAQIRALKVTRAVLSTVARRGSTAKEMTLMNKLARLSAAQRQQIVDDFVEEIFHGLDTADPWIRERTRSIGVQLPDDPTPQQVDAWVELAELLQNPDFRAAMRRMIEYNAADRTPDTPAGASATFFKRLVELAGGARERGVAPESPEADAVLTELLGEGTDRAAVLRRIDLGNEVARYRELAAVIKGESEPPRFQEEVGWVVAALRAWPGR
ncbi:helix-turn-helix domain-containing protein [Streptomyces broussonetiae]|uniref:MerR family transcriptional regulator n=1 Tax=Streptomyces broussonetiae TaxID=2686304 RepID=A0A6I6NFB1_9ACTN|nr:MerR family transcriptional regulator [Streptomyces broussonetiae]QHA06946.1 MerR family transcriptional regulator [Streptomyces broussonetiae]